LLPFTRLPGLETDMRSVPAKCRTLNSPTILEWPLNAPFNTHTCFMCGADAAFGFNTRTGDVWTWMSHRSNGDKRVVAPGASGSKAATGRASAEGR
jgi:hypothetical protein